MLRDTSPWFLQMSTRSSSDFTSASLEKVMNTQSGVSSARLRPFVKASFDSASLAAGTECSSLSWNGTNVRRKPMACTISPTAPRRLGGCSQMGSKEFSNASCRKRPAREM